MKKEYLIFGGLGLLALLGLKRDIKPQPILLGDILPSGVTPQGTLVPKSEAITVDIQETITDVPIKASGHGVLKFQSGQILFNDIPIWSAEGKQFKEIGTFYGGSPVSDRRYSNTVYNPFQGSYSSRLNIISAPISSISSLDGDELTITWLDGNITSFKVVE